MSDNLQEYYPQPESIEADWNAYQETGYFFYLAKCCTTCLEYGPDLPEEVAQALKKHLTEYCNADDTKGAQKALGLGGGKDGGSSQFSRARSDEKRRQIIDQVDMVRQFEDCSQDPPQNAPLKTTFPSVAEFFETTPDFVKQVWYERQRSK